MSENEKIKVEFINNSTGEKIGVSYVSIEKLPQTFEIETTIHAGSGDWIVEEAIPANSIDFIKSKQVILKLRKVEYVDPNDILFTLPSISNEIAGTGSISLFNDFELSILEDDWRQNEFLHKSAIHLVEKEIIEIKSIWKNNSKTGESGLTTFNKCHVRSSIGEPNLNINFEQLKAILKTNKIGNLKFHNTNGFVKDAFAIETEFTSYYGILKNNTVTQFCMYEFSEDTLNEVKNICTAFNVLFINWYHADVKYSN